MYSDFYNKFHDLFSRCARLQVSGNSVDICWDLPVFPKAGPRLNELKTKTGVFASIRKSLSARLATRMLPGVRRVRHLEIISFIL